MSSADLFEDGFPHGTADGYDKGCRGAACSAGIEHGLSCKTAKMKSRSDFQYQKLVKSGAGVAEIADALGLIGTAAAAAKPKPKPKRAASKPDPVVEPVPVAEYFGDNINRDADDAPAAADVDEPAPTPAPAEDELVETETETTAPTPREIRAWAREKGYEVSTRGIIPTAVVEHYWEAHGLLEPGQPTTVNEAGPVDEPQTTAPAPTPAPELERPDFGTMNLEHDLTEALTERDDARDLAARLWDELDRLERTRAQEQAATSAARKADADTLDEAHTDITNLTTALATSKQDRHQLHTALAAASAALQTTERALELVLQKWDDATRRNGIASHAVDALTYIDKSLDNVAGLDADLSWANVEVVEMLEDARSLLLLGVVTPGSFELPTDREVGSPDAGPH